VVPVVTSGVTSGRDVSGGGHLEEGGAATGALHVFVGVALLVRLLVLHLPSQWVWWLRKLLQLFAALRL
jgi:hypothetical protein